MLVASFTLRPYEKIDIRVLYYCINVGSTFYMDTMETD